MWRRIRRSAVEHALPHPSPAGPERHHPWRTIAVVVAALAVLELLGLVVVGIALVAKPMAHRSMPTPRRRDRRPWSEARRPSRCCRCFRATVSVTILNGNGVSGAAASEASRVRARGYIVGRVGNAPRGSYGHSVVMYRAGRVREAYRLSRTSGSRSFRRSTASAKPTLHGAKLAVVVGSGYRLQSHISVTLPGARLTPDEAGRDRLPTRDRRRGPRLAPLEAVRPRPARVGAAADRLRLHPPAARPPRWHDALRARLRVGLDDPPRRPPRRPRGGRRSPPEMIEIARGAGRQERVDVSSRWATWSRSTSAGSSTRASSTTRSTTRRAPTSPSRARTGRSSQAGGSCSSSRTGSTGSRAAMPPRETGRRVRPPAGAASRSSSARRASRTSAASTTRASASSRTRPPTWPPISPSRGSTAPSAPSGRRSGSAPSSVGRTEPRLDLLQQGRREVAVPVELDRPSERSDRAAVVADAHLEAAELVPRAPVERLQLDRLRVERPRGRVVAELLGGARLDEQRLDRERVQRARVARVDGRASWPPRLERGDGGVGRALREPG